MRQLLKNARIYDGTGSEPYVSDILIEDDRIAKIELRTVISDQRIILRLRDNCRRFDPVEWNKVMNPDDPTKNIGLRIVFGKAEDVSYSSALDLNNVCVIISTVTS